LACGKLLPKEFAILGVARADKTTDSFREELNLALTQFHQDRIDPKTRQWLIERVYYLRGNFDDPELYNQLKQTIPELDTKHKTNSNYIYYLATASEYFAKVTEQLGVAGLAQQKAGCWRRLIIEKPFGQDLDSAKQLDQQLLSVVSEDQIYRIDHYLGKETVQNILVFRFANGLFEPLWNNRFVDHIQITVAETIGVEGRGGFYETAGALRDMLPNHLFQLLALTAMEPPSSFAADAVRDEKTKVLQAIQPFSEQDILTNAVRGQYGAGEIDERQYLPYRSEPRVASDSSVETFVAAKLLIDNWRWADVPFYVRTGKALAERVTEVAIQFRRVPFMLFRNTPIEKYFLILRIQPDEGISIEFGSKIPGPTMRATTVKMNFNYSDYFGTTAGTGYETLIYDCMIGDAMLFQRADTVEAGWKVVTPILEAWQSTKPKNFPNYFAGSWGPEESFQLLQRDGRNWRMV
jgi:glucose-6-phosphate 1-dehydrogenase